MSKPKFSIGDIIVVNENHYLIEDFDAGRYVCRNLENNIINKIGWWAFDSDLFIYVVA
jgi:hypothetical protein